jgi:hypothetical protein
MPDLDFKDNVITGYTSPALYVGSPGTTFVLHAEDMNLGSVNYLVAGAPKVWYVVPSSDNLKVVDLVSKLFANEKLVKTCPQAVMHKRFLIHPDTLREHGITCSRIVQEQGDLIVTFPGAFHFGYNSAYNIAEATNFATHEWYSGGHFQDSLNVGRCSCITAPRFYFDKKLVIQGLKRVANLFGLDSKTLRPLQVISDLTQDASTSSTIVLPKKKKKKKTIMPSSKTETMKEMSAMLEVTEDKKKEEQEKNKIVIIDDGSMKIPIETASYAGSDSTRTAASITETTAALVVNKKRPFSAPPSPTNSASTVEVELCDDDFQIL